MANPHKIPFVGKYKKSMDSIKREDEQGLLYQMAYSADYYKLLPLFTKKAGAGCSTFFTKNMEGEALMARNFDFRHYRNADDSSIDNLTSLAVLVRCENPRAKYRSIGLADAYFLDYKGGHFSAGVLDDGKTDVSLGLVLPFLCMDGVNEQGLAVSIMMLPTKCRWEETEYREFESLTEAEKKKAKLLTVPGEVPDGDDPRIQADALALNTADRKAWKANKKFAVNQNRKGRKTVMHTVLMRMMLDSCATVEEAIRLAESVNIKSAIAESDFHVMVGDTSGRSVMLEWTEEQMIYADLSHGTNYYGVREDHYGYGQERDDIMAAAVRYYQNGMPEKTAMRMLGVVSQDIRDGSGPSFTQWSAVYNLAQKSLKLCMQMDYDRVFEYRLTEEKE